MISRMEGKEHRQTLTPEGGDGNRGHSKTSCDGLLNSRPPRGKTSNPSECVMKRPRETGRDHLSEWGRNYQVRGRRAGEDGRGGTTARVIRKWTALGFSRSSFLSSCGNLCPSAERGGEGGLFLPSYYLWTTFAMHRMRWLGRTRKGELGGQTGQPGWITIQPKIEERAMSGRCWISSSD